MQRWKTSNSTAWFAAVSAAAIASAAASAGSSDLNPLTVPKYVHPLVVPPPMPKVAVDIVPGVGPVDRYEIGVRQFLQQVLPESFPLTTVWGYGSVQHPETFNYPAFTIEARWNRPVRVTWINDLVDANGEFLPHLLPVDPTLHWANPPGGVDGRDSTPSFDTTPGPYTGPVPIVTHLHGGSTGQESDGYSEAWHLPVANNIPADYAMVGSLYEEFEAVAEQVWGTAWFPGSATFTYENRQPAGTLWYHDHTLGMTRLNVYAGLAGFYLLRGGPNDVNGNRLPRGAYEIPLAIQDRSFFVDGSLRYPLSRSEFDGFEGPYIPDSDIAPIWNPEFFGDTIVVNGRTWPSFTAEARRYRMRLLNGCDSRFLILKLVDDPYVARPATPDHVWHQIGSDHGFLRRPVTLDQVLLGPGERMDVILDLTNVEPGSSIYIINEGPDEPFGGGTAGVDFEPANPLTTGQVMRIDIVEPISSDRTAPPSRLRLPAPSPVGEADRVRRVALLEEESAVLPDVGPRAALLGVIEDDGEVIGLPWSAPISEVVEVGSTEVWEIYNFTQDAHPIHLHEVSFNVVDRIDDLGMGDIIPAPESEAGPKDTVIAYPGQVTRIRATFGRAGLFAWHCHVLSHEDNEMMRPMLITSEIQD